MGWTLDWTGAQTGGVCRLTVWGSEAAKRGPAGDASCAIVCVDPLTHLAGWLPWSRPSHARAQRQAGRSAVAGAGGRGKGGNARAERVNGESESETDGTVSPWAAVRERGGGRAGRDETARLGRTGGTRLDMRAHVRNGTAAQLLLRLACSPLIQEPASCFPTITPVACSLPFLSSLVGLTSVLCPA